jgi:hypothetical protein
LAVEQSEEWLTGRRYLDLEELREQRPSDGCGEAEEAMLVEIEERVRLLGGIYRTFRT